MSTRAERTAVIDNLEQQFKNAKGIYITHNVKINVEKVTKLRNDLRNQGIRYLVVKNTLAREACKRIGYESINEHFKGPVAVTIADGDATAPAKILRAFQKENKLLGTKAAYVDGTLFTGDEAGRLADLPSRDVLLAMLLGCLKAPMGNMAGVLNGILLKFVGTLEALKDQKSSEQ